MLCRAYLPFLHSIRYHNLDVIHARHINDVMAVQNHLASQLVHVLADLAVLYHNNDHINVSKERIQIMILVLDHILGDKWILDLQTGCPMAFLTLQQLQRRRLTHIIHVLFIGQAIETDTAHIGKTLFFHDLVDTV